MINRPLLQVISTSPQDSRVIQNFQADRIELVSAIEIGGITPSQIVVRKSLEAADILTMVMVRHHNLGFILSSEQQNNLISEAISLCEMGVKGLVVGAITSDNKIEQSFLQKFTDEISNKVSITFHKASDQTDLLQAYSILKKHNIKRVLTQGGKHPILENGQVIKNLIKFDGVTTLLGGGINNNNIGEIVKKFNPLQIHIGTCVRTNKYGPVDGKLLEQFIQKMGYHA